MAENPANSMTEASRAKHKFAVKRNSWPKTRGVAMNPVDHPHGGVSREANISMSRYSLTPCSRVTINISVKLRRSPGTLPKVKRRVLLLRGERVCFVVPRRSRNKEAHESIMGLGFTDCIVLHVAGTVHGRGKTSMLFSRIPWIQEIKSWPSKVPNPVRERQILALWSLANASSNLSVSHLRPRLWQWGFTNSPQNRTISTC